MSESLSPTFPKNPKRRIRSRAGAALAVERALKRAGFDPCIRDDEDEPVVSLNLGGGKWADVFVKVNET